ncbi:MAG TPA: dicarboxylate/amino acid:cation symporter [Gammaproteobacteria bacterium]|nr:dicarboxylate/amino acid:cation symporter [Gammaproteobacteria bacterium]
MTYTQKIVLAMAGGVVAGAALSSLSGPGEFGFDILVDGIFSPTGQIFIALLQMMVVPLVLVSLVCGVTSLGDVAALGRLGVKTFALYMFTTAVAIVLALALSSLVSPGEGFEMAGEVAFESQPAPPLSEVLVNMFPSNPIRALAEGQMLQIIVFALFLGFALTRCGETGARIAAIFDDLNGVVMRMVLMVIELAPIGVFALIARTFAEQGLDVFGPLAGYFFCVVAALILHLTITYPTILTLSRLNPIRFLGKMRAVMTFAFSTSSSAATIPLTLNTVETRLGVRNSVASFTVPLGATINMDGTAIMQGCATVFIANVYGVDLSLGDFMSVILTATLASIGTAAVPGAGLVMLAMVLSQVGLPVEGIGLILGIDRLLDMLRTAVNVTGDSAVTCAVAKSEGALDQATFDDPTVTIESLRIQSAR